MMDSSDGASPTSSPAPFDIESFRLQLATITARVQSKVSVESLRPLPVFLGLRDSSQGLHFSFSSFSTPRTATDIQTRLRRNADYFLSNYVLVASMVAMVVTILHYEMIMAVGIVYGLWMLHWYLIQHSVVVGGVALHALLTVQQRFYVLFVISVVAIMWECLVPVVLIVGISALLVGVHAVLRTPVSGDDMMVNGSSASESAPLMAKV